VTETTTEKTTYSPTEAVVSNAAITARDLATRISHLASNSLVNPLDVANVKLLYAEALRVVKRAESILWNINEREKYAATVASVATNAEGSTSNGNG